MTLPLTNETLTGADCVFVHTAHLGVAWGRVKRVAGQRVVDSRGVTAHG